MILVKLNEANFEYDIRSLIRSFVPKEEVIVHSPKEHRELEQPPKLCLEITYYPDKITMHIQGDAVGEIQEQASLDFLKSGDFSVQNDYTCRIETKNALKRMLYFVMSTIFQKELPWGTLTGIRPVKIPMALLEEGKTPEQIYTTLKETYCISDEKNHLSVQIAQKELDILKDIDYEHGYSLYVGIPFCPSTCLYCSFTSYPIGRWEKQVDAYLDALCKELEFIQEAMKERPLNTIYIGGGTPTSLSAAQLTRLLSKITELFDRMYLREFTVEAGRPDSITREKLEAIHSFPVTRISINPQTMKQETLDFIGRKHSVEQIKECFKMARDVGFDNINMDIILGLPNEHKEDVKETIREIKKLNPDNLTVHSLALKRAAKLNMFREKYEDVYFESSENVMGIASDGAKEMDMKPYYLYRQKNMSGNLENTGFAREGKEGIYNILIMEEKQTIIAAGAGAVSKFVTKDPAIDHGTRIERAENVKDVKNYLDRIDEMIDRKRSFLEKV